MDETSFLAVQVVGDDENEVDDDDEHSIVTAAAILVCGAEAACLLRNENRKPSRNYLTRSNLP